MDPNVFINSKYGICFLLRVARAETPQKKSPSSLPCVRRQGAMLHLHVFHGQRATGGLSPPPPGVLAFFRNLAALVGDCSLETNRFRKRSEACAFLYCVGSRVSRVFSQEFNTEVLGG